MIKLTDDCYKLNVDSNVYLLQIGKNNILIDVGPEDYKELVSREIEQIIPLNQINIVIFTHLHFDHIGNFDLFSNAKFYTSKTEIDYLRSHPEYAVFNDQLASRFKVKLEQIDNLKMSELQVIFTPGHTKGSFCIYYKKAKILFTGDTLFENGFGRTDLPNSAPDEMEQSLKKLEKIDYSILAPGHDY